ncbi:hypothetical protein H8959_002566 [Pygathrix nigripes]
MQEASPKNIDACPEISLSFSEDPPDLSLLGFGAPGVTCNLDIYRASRLRPFIVALDMDSDTLQAFQNELICSICTNFFIDPVTIDCGHSFCRPCLCLCWEEGRAPMHCPECREISAKPDFNTNVTLKKLASLARQTSTSEHQQLTQYLCAP